MVILINCEFNFFSVTQCYTSSLNAPLDKNSLLTIHQRNLRCLAIEIFKINNKLSTPFICDLIHESTSKCHTIAEEENVMSIPKAKKVKTGIESYRPYNMEHTIGRICEYQVFRILQIEIEKLEIYKLSLLNFQKLHCWSRLLRLKLSTQEQLF